MGTRKKRYVIIYEGPNKPDAESELNRLEADGYLLHSVVPGFKAGPRERVWPAYVMELWTVRNRRRRKAAEVVKRWHDQQMDDIPF